MKHFFLGVGYAQLGLSWIIDNFGLHDILVVGERDIATLDDTLTAVLDCISSLVTQTWFPLSGQLSFSNLFSCLNCTTFC
jgi:hypothetical protein